MRTYYLVWTSYPPVNELDIKNLDCGYIKFTTTEEHPQIYAAAMAFKTVVNLPELATKTFYLYGPLKEDGQHADYVCCLNTLL